MSLLTPEVLYAAADKLHNYYSGYPLRVDDAMYMCVALDHSLPLYPYTKADTLKEFYSLLSEHGIHPAGNLHYIQANEYCYTSFNGDLHESQNVRFMFLEFLAWSMQ